MINQKKVYIGAIDSENEAAKYYDMIAIVCQGLSAKTNFSYSAKKVKQILQDFDCKVDSPDMNHDKLLSQNSDENLMITKHLIDDKS